MEKEKCLQIPVPGNKELCLRHLVLDYNGTLAVDGELIAGVMERLAGLADRLWIHIVTADTFGSVLSMFAGSGYDLFILPEGNQTEAKRKFVESLGPDSCVCIGNGRNDELMLKSAALGVVVIQEEGAAVATLLAADIAAPTILRALDLLEHPLRLVATLRS